MYSAMQPESRLIPQMQICLAVPQPKGMCQPGTVPSSGTSDSDPRRSPSGASKSEGKSRPGTVNPRPAWLLRGPRHRTIRRPGRFPLNVANSGHSRGEEAFVLDLNGPEPQGAA